MRQCRLCLEWKPLEDFYATGPKERGWRVHRCKPCYLAAKRVGRPTARGREDVRVRNLRLRYGLSPEKLEGMRATQGGGCAMCGQVDRRLVVDHDHGCCPTNISGRTCGRCVRGLLCDRCNNALSLLENPRLLEQATEYLELWNPVIACDLADMARD